MERLPTHAFGRTFTHLPEFVREDLSSLEREGVIYTDHWIDDLDDFRHVRIVFTDDEIGDYARRVWAFELFLRAGSPTWARTVPGIDKDVAQDADSYVMRTKDGKVFGPPYHCFAAFLGTHLASIQCGVSDRRVIIELQGRESALFTLYRAIDALTPAIRSFNHREKGLTQWAVTREDDVRDLLYVMLRPSFSDLVKEEPVPSKAGGHKFVDLCSRVSRLMIELKWIRKTTWRRTIEEVYTDIQTYVAHPASATVVFVIVDSYRAIPDPRLIEAEVSGVQQLSGKSVEVRLRIVEP